MRIFRHLCKIVSRAVLLNTVALMPVAGQTVDFGIKAGAPITDAFVVKDQAWDLTNYTFNTQRYTFGPTFEFRLPYRFSFEVDGLYKRLRYISYPFGFDSFRGTTTANSWEFPLLIKRYFNTTLHPYGNAGVSFRRISGGNTVFTNGEFQSTEEPLEITSKNNTGFVAGAGVDFAKGRIHFQPEIRYTRWGKANFSSSNGVLRSNLNSVDVLVGVTFRKD
jgi:opacity protein-like surface antigen